MRILKVFVDDRKNIIKRNELHVINEVRKNSQNNYYVSYSDAFTLVGKGAEQIVFALSEEGVINMFEEPLKSSFLKERYLKEERGEKKIYDLMDAAPLYSAIHIDVEDDEGVYHVILIKESMEEKERNSEFRIPELHMTFK